MGRWRDGPVGGWIADGGGSGHWGVESGHTDDGGRVEQEKVHAVVSFICLHTVSSHHTIIMSLCRLQPHTCIQTVCILSVLLYFLIFQYFTHLSVSDIDPSRWISKQSSHYTLEASVCDFSKNKSLLYIHDLEERRMTGAIMILQVFLPSHILRRTLYVVCE